MGGGRLHCRAHGADLPRRSEAVPENPGGSTPRGCRAQPRVRLASGGGGAAGCASRDAHPLMTT